MTEQAGAQAPAKLRLAGAYPADSFHTINLMDFARDVRDVTKGRIDLEVQANAELLKAADAVAGVADGRADAAEVFMSTLAKDDPVMSIDSFPFMVASYAQARALWTVSRATVAEALAKRGLVVLFAVPWPPQNLFSNRAINRTEDFRGLRMRYYSPATQRLAQLLGTTPVSTAMQMESIEKAIAAGNFDLMMTSSLAGVITKAWSTMTHYYQINASIPKNIVFMRKAAMDRCSPADQQALVEAAGRAEVRGWLASEKANAEFEAQLVQHKMVVAGMDLAARRFLERAGERLAIEWTSNAQPAELQVMSRYMALKVAPR